MAAMPSTRISVVSVGVAIVSVIGGALGILKSCSDELEGRILAKQALSDAKLACVREIEALNERWHERNGK